MTSPADPITPEIHADALAARLTQLAALPWVRHVLEVGTGSGLGSTAALWAGLRDKGWVCDLVTIEASRERAAAAAAHYREDPGVLVLAGPAVPVRAYPSAEAVADFYGRVPSRLQRYPLEEVLAWRSQELAYLAATYPADHPGVLAELRAAWDLVLLDGSEFTGPAELAAVGEPPLLVLDDVASFKHWTTFNQLSARPETYRLLEHGPGLRNGYAIFARRDVAEHVTLPPLPPLL